MSGAQGRRGGRPDRGRQVRAEPGARPRARRRGGQRRLDAALPGHGHRHREADARPSGAAYRITCWTSGTVTEPASVAEYQRLARAAIDDIAARGPHAAAGRRLRACTCGRSWRSSSSPAPTPTCGPRWRRSWPRSGPAPLHARLRGARPGGGGADPAQQRPAHRAGAGGDRADRRPVRGRAARAAALLPAVHLGVDLDTAVLDERVARRVDQMWAAGLVDEVRGLERSGLRDGPHRQPGARATSRCCGSWPASATRRRRARHGPGHAAVRAAAAVVVPPRPADRAGWTRRAGPGRAALAAAR